MSWINSIADQISSNGLGTQGSSLFIGQLPDVNVLTTLLTEYQGDVIETLSSASIALNRPSLQVMVKGVADDYQNPRTRIVAIQNLLQQITNQTLGGIYFVRVRPTSSILSLGQDDRLRWSFSCNFEVIVGSA